MFNSSPKLLMGDMIDVYVFDSYQNFETSLMRSQKLCDSERERENFIIIPQVEWL